VHARLGQHFLISPEVRDAILEAAGVLPSDRVLEIGPGRGMLTRALLGRGAEVVAVELDEGLAESLEAELSCPRLRLLRADFLKLDLKELGAGPLKVVANLPYAVATPILQRLLPWPLWRSGVLMFQKEVAARLTASPGSGSYGLLTLSVLLYAQADEVLEVPRESFLPRPRVASALVLLRRRPEPLLPSDKRAAFFKVAKAAFSERRKMASSPISRLLGLAREEVDQTLARLGVDPRSRAEQIPLEAFLRLPEGLGL